MPSEILMSVALIGTLFLIYAVLRVQQYNWSGARFCILAASAFCFGLLADVIRLLVERHEQPWHAPRLLASGIAFACLVTFVSLELARVSSTNGLGKILNGWLRLRKKYLKTKHKNEVNSHNSHS